MSVLFLPYAVFSVILSCHLDFKKMGAGHVVEAAADGCLPSIHFSLILATDPEYYVQF